jgi:putative Holliday junction resolvase
MNAVMALDVGSKRIGVAVSDPSGTFALPIGTIERSSLRQDLERIRSYVESYSVKELVVGYPITLSGKHEIAAKHMDEFIASVQRVFSGEIHRVDERLTTAEATKTMIAGGASRKRRRESVDMMAAALILETYLARSRRRS